MTSLLIILGWSCGTCLLMTPVVRALASRCGLVDRPDGDRKVHARATPVAGGLAVLLAAASAVGAALIVPNPFQPFLWAQRDRLLGLILAAIVICTVGLLDDRYALRARHKFMGQLLAIAVVMGFGVWVPGIGLFGCQIDLGVFTVPFTIFWLLGAINSLNLIDGMDGMLSSVSVIICVAMAAMALLVGQWAAAGIAAAMAGALLGFLRYNFPPASVFLGDTGSMLVGLVVGVLAIQSSLKGPATVALAFPIAILTIPIFDTGAALIRRKLTGRGISMADRGHLHHCLLNRGFSSRRVLACVSGFSLLAATGALVSLFFNSEVFALLSAATVIAILITTRLFGHAEFLLVKQFFTARLAAWVQERRPAAAPPTPRAYGLANGRGLANNATESTSSPGEMPSADHGRSATAGNGQKKAPIAARISVPPVPLDPALGLQPSPP